MRKNILVTASVLATASVAALSLGLASPAAAADSGLTFTITGGALSVTAPAGPVSLGTQATGGTPSIGGPLGTVTVTDARGALLATWTATATSTAFTTGGATANETIANSLITYAPGAATATTGIAVRTAGPGGVMSASQTAFSATGVVGNNTTSWNPTVTVAVPAAAVTGTYNAVMTHSVA